jgi:hypothetical protein
LTPLAHGYIAQLSHCGREAWHDVIGRFADANLFQTWSYDMVRYDREKVTHLLLMKGDTLVSAAQVRIARVSANGVGIAYVMRGPLWRREGEPRDVEVFRQAVRALRNEFSCRKGLVFRLYPMAYKDTESDLMQIMREEGYKPFDRRMNRRTLIVDLERSLDNLRSGFDQKWRNCLNRAEKNGLTMTFGEDDSLFDKVESIYAQMVRRKKLLDTTDLHHLKAVQHDLPSALKMRVVLCGVDNELSAAAIFSAIGDTAVYLVGATNDEGMKTKGSYLIQWAFLKWIKERGFLRYDLNGINPRKNAGTYHFKRGLAGSMGRDVELTGKFQVADNALSSIVVRSGEAALWGYRKILRLARRMSNRGGSSNRARVLP